MKCLFLFTHKAEENLNSHLPLEMYPLLDKPFAVHCLERIVQAYDDVDSFHFLSDHYPEAVKEYFSDGTRWGKKIKHYSMINHEQPSKVVKDIIEDEKEVIILNPCHLAEKIIPLKANEALSFNDKAFWLHVKVQDILSELNEKQNFSEILEQFSKSDKVKLKDVKEFYSCSSAQALLDSHQIFFKSKEKNLKLTCHEIEENVFIASNVILHPSVQITAPVYIGHNCQVNKGVKLNSGSIINNNVIIDEETSVENSIILDNNYIGCGLEINNSIVDRLYLYNCSYKAQVPIVDSCFVADLHRDKSPSALTRLMAFFCFIQFIPLIFLLLLYRHAKGQKLTHKKSYISPHKNSQDGSEIAKFIAFQEQPFSRKQSYLRHFLYSFIPGLISVIKGEMNIFGIMPKTYEQLNNQRTREIYLQSPLGLLSEDYLNDLMDKEDIHEIRKIPVQSLRSKVKLLFRYFCYVCSLTKVKNTSVSPQLKTVDSLK